MSEDHRPRILMVVSEAPPRWMAMAPPARREWLETFSGWMLNLARPRVCVVFLTAEEMSCGVVCLPGLWIDVKNVPSIVCG